MRKLALVVVALLFALAAPAFAQTQSNLNFNLGAGALGLGGSATAAPATDIVLTVNPGFAKLPNLSLRSDSLLAPAADLQFYGGGAEYKLPVASKTGLFSKVYFTANASFGLDRIVPATGPSQAHFGLMAGGAVHYLTASGVDINLFQAGYLRTPGAPWGSSCPYFGGSVSYFFGKH